MMQKEFEALTGIYVTAEMYKAIEKAYYEFDGDKGAFCHAYKTNEDGLAEKVQKAADDAESKAEIQIKALGTEIDFLKNDVIARLNRELDKEQEWKPYESKNNVQ